MLKHEPIPNTVYISSSGFPVMFLGISSDSEDCTKKQATYSLVTESFDSERKSLFTCSVERFKERFSPISEFDEERKVFKRRVMLVTLGSKFYTHGMLSPNEKNQTLLEEFVARERHPVRITNMTRDPDMPRYYTDEECQDAWLENLNIATYGDQNQFKVLSAELVTDQLDNEYVQQFFPRDDQGRFTLPNRYVTSIQVETEEDWAIDGRAQLKVLHNAFALI